MFLKILLILQLSSLFAFSTHAQREVKLRIIQTSDVHGALFPFDYINNSAVDYGLAHILTYVNQLRESSEQEIILLDNGDILQGQPTVYYANYIDTLSNHVVSEAMNYMGYDAATIGNHDIEAGPNIYDRLLEEFNFPWLAANIIDTRTGLPYFKPYTVIERDGIRVAVMGLITPGVPKWLSPNLWPNMEFKDMIETAHQWMDSIKTKENPHIVIGLFHSGHDAYYEGSNPQEPLNENASLLVAQQVPGFDAVFIGHDHDQLVKKTINVNGDSVLIAGPGARARYVSDISVNLRLCQNDEVVNKSITGELAPMQGYIPNPLYVSHFSGFTRRVEEYVDQKIGYFTKTITTRDAYFGPSSFVNLIHQVQLGVSNADISFAAPLSFNTQIENGNVFIRDMFKLYSYENLLYIMRLTGEEIKDYLEYSYGLWLNTMESEDDHLLLFRKDKNNLVALNNNGSAMLRSSFYNFDSAAGINYTVDVTKPIGDRITIISLEDGREFSLESEYRVAINSYRGMGGGGHLTDGIGLSQSEINNRVVSRSSHDMRHFLVRWIERNQNIVPVESKNWLIIPEDWVENAAKKDRILLFGE